MKKGKGIGGFLLESLTEEQVASLLDVFLSAVDISQVEKMLKQADPDMAETVARILSMSHDMESRPAAAHLASGKRVLQRWESLWEQWGSLVFELGDEDGMYAEQEAHWEPPYFCGDAFSDDLDRIAREMIPIVDNVFYVLNRPDLFLEALDEIEDGIDLYPEWMGVEYGDKCILGEETTRLILRWLWLSSRDGADPDRDFLDRILEIEKRYRLVELSPKGHVDFFDDLPEETRGKIYEAIEMRVSSDSLEDVRSPWHMIHHIYQKQFEPRGYLDTCREHLADNWRYGGPLIEDAIERRDFQEAEALLEKTFGGCLGSETNKAKWFPEESLLIIEQGYIPKEDKEEISRLLEVWEGVARELGNKERCAAIRFQTHVLHNHQDWQAVISEYLTQKDARGTGALESLFAQWQAEMAKCGFNQFLGEIPDSDTWIHWLIEAKTDIRGKRDWFLEKVNTWVASLKKQDGLFQKQWPLLALLTKDLQKTSGGLVKRYPGFCKAVFPGDSSWAEIERSRRSALKQIKAADSFMSGVMEVWKTQIHSIIPDPARAHKSDYRSHARWMKALFELDPDGYSEMLAMWKQEHWRRRNLWRDMKALNLPV